MAKSIPILLWCAPGNGTSEEVSVRGLFRGISASARVLMTTAGHPRVDMSQAMSIVNHRDSTIATDIALPELGFRADAGCVISH